MSKKSPRRPPSLADAHAFRPSLGSVTDLPDYEGGLAPKRPARLWRVSDTTLVKLPLDYPYDRRCTRVLTDPPSILAVRVAECLRKRSISTEYDEEAALATCVTVDRCHLNIKLWKAGDKVMVECSKIRGSSLTFYATVRAVLDAAESSDDGADRRAPHQVSVLEYPRLLKIDPRLVSLPSPASTALAEEVAKEMERVVSMLGKDRIEAQQLGMERLVGLTDTTTSGTDTTLYASMTVLGAPMMGANDVFEDWILRLIVDRVLPSETSHLAAPLPEASFSFSCASSILGEEPSADRSMVGFGDEHHGGSMRSMALRALTNALEVLDCHQPKILAAILNQYTSGLTSLALITALVDDLAGASRPPAVVAGTRLASQHEAVYALKALRLLGRSSSTARRRIANESTLNMIAKARDAGASTHAVLAEEARLSYQQLSEDVRSC